jgi:hypothetical protein
MFRVGQKVVCVDARGTLQKDAIYTVLGIELAPSGRTILQVDCPPDIGGCSGYYATRFRPIVERKTDISVFKAMLTPAGKELVR